MEKLQIIHSATVGNPSFGRKHIPIFKCLLMDIHNLSEVLTESSQGERRFLSAVKANDFFKRHFSETSFFNSVLFLFCDLSPPNPSLIKISVFILYISTRKLLNSFCGGDGGFSIKNKLFQDVFRTRAGLPRKLNQPPVSPALFPVEGKCSSEKVTPLCTPV